MCQCSNCNLAQRYKWTREEEAPSKQQAFRHNSLLCLAHWGRSDGQNGIFKMDQVDMPTNGSLRSDMENCNQRESSQPYNFRRLPLLFGFFLLRFPWGETTQQKNKMCYVFTFKIKVRDSMSIKTMSTLPFRTTKVKVYFLGIISLSIYIPHKNIFNLYVSYFPDMYFLYHIFSNSLNKISKMCWVFTFKIKVRDKVFLIPCQSKQCQPCHSQPPKSRSSFYGSYLYQYISAQEYF